MTTAPQIHSLHLARLAGEPMEKMERVQIIAGQGIAGDRYAAGIGAFSKTKIKIRHISLIALSGITDANHQLQIHQRPLFSEGDTRRNVVIDHLSSHELNKLVGKIFYLGGLAFKGTELCAPCQRPANLLSRPDFIKAFEGRGGIRAEALESGILTIRDLLTIPSAQ